MQGRAWMHTVTAATLLAAGCAGEAQPRKERPADRATRQYAAERTVPLAPASAWAGAATRDRDALPRTETTSLRGDT